MTNNKELAVFFDRDGTLNVESGYIRNLNDLVLADQASVAVKKLNDAGITTILVTNQTGPARGYYPESHVLDLNNRLKSLLQKDGAYLDGYYYCPHYKNGIIKEYSFDCECRKPKKGMIDKALQDFPYIILNKSYVIGDKATDIELSHNANCKGILLKTGYGQQVLDGNYQELKIVPHYIAENIIDAVEWVLYDSKLL